VEKRIVIIDRRKADGEKWRQNIGVTAAADMLATATSVVGVGRSEAAGGQKPV
jgi:hypothetical protein